MKEILNSASALHNWKQRAGIVPDRRGGKSHGSTRRKLESMLARAIDRENYREIAGQAGMNSADLVELLTRRLPDVGPNCLEAAIQAMTDHGTVTCLQYLDSL